ncbi:hypothetical protein [Ferrovibrio sp.]|jgi:hypothetical protein|uniref:hypothetical protein n=1 Tax=Ferrovibrio sp. TaxID=1917215 RepID=UPI0035AF361A
MPEVIDPSSFSANPAAQPASPSPSSPRRRRVDWENAAILIAGGATLQEVAAQLGCRAHEIRRNLKRSPRFQRLIDQAFKQQHLRGQLRFAALAERTVRYLQDAEKLDARTLQWLGAQLGLERGDRLLTGHVAERLRVALGLARPAAQDAPPPDAPQAVQPEAIEVLTLEKYRELVEQVNASMAERERQAAAARAAQRLGRDEEEEWG